MPYNTKAPDEKSGNYTFACTVDIIINPVDKITKRDASSAVDKVDFLDKDIDAYCQISFTLPDNTKAPDEKSGNYTFASTVDTS